MSGLRPPKGTRDFLPDDMVLRRGVLELLRWSFQLYGFEEWDGPAFEYLEALEKKSGEGIKDEIYVFEDKSGRELGLRFELTSSLARIVANNPQLKKPLRVYNIGKVWRYEKPQAGRYREFYQADVDVFGSDSRLAEAELISLAGTALDLLGFSGYEIRLNSRKILSSQMRLAGVPEKKRQDAFQALDKLEKIGKEGVEEEFENRGIKSKVFDKLYELLSLDGSNEDKLNDMKEVLDEEGKEGVRELEEIISILEDSEIDVPVSVSPTLVRGLAYYTGPVFEASSSQSDIGSFAGGGRYDNLVSDFGGRDTPAVGLSFGVERLIDLIKERDGVTLERGGVCIVYYDEDLLPDALGAAKRLRQEGISAFLDLNKRSLGKQLEYADVVGAAYSFLIFPDGETKLKDMESEEEAEMSLEDVISEIQG